LKGKLKKKKSNVSKNLHYHYTKVFIVYLCFRQDPGMGGQARLQLGLFVVSPAIGQISPGNSMIINVDCVAESPGGCEEVKCSCSIPGTVQN